MVNDSECSNGKTYGSDTVFRCVSVVRLLQTPPLLLDLTKTAGMPPERVLSLIVLVVFPLACQKSSLPQFCSGVVKRSSFRWAVAGGA